jgi:ssDNA-specific exonuclease RecJ
MTVPVNGALTFNDSFTSKEFNEVAANFLCHDPIYLSMAQSKLNFKELYSQPEIENVD